MSYCVYRHVSPDGKMYIGVTCQSTKDRWRNGKGYYGNSHFKRAIQKYGWENFSHEIIKSNLTQDAAYALETELIAKHNTTNQNYGYNHDKGGKGSNEGHLSSEESKEKRRKAMKGKNKGINLCGLSARAKKVNQYTLDGEFIQTWGSTTEAQRGLGVNYTCIVRCCRGQIKSAGGYLWVYTGDDLLIPQMVEKANAPKKLSDSHKAKIRDGMRGKQHDSIKKAVEGKCIETGKIVRYNSMTEAQKDGFDRSAISACISAKKPHSHSHKGYLWKLVEK